MSNFNKPAMTIAQRKQKLIQEGAKYRSGLVNATDDLKDGLHRGLLFRGVLGQVISVAAGILRSHAGDRMGLPALVPIVMSGITMFARTPLIKPVVGGAVALGAIAAGLRYIGKKKNRPN